MKKIILEDGKYKILVPDQPDESFECLRNGEPWRDLNGDKLILALCQRIQSLEDQIKDL